MLLFLLAISLICIFQKQTRKFLIPFLIIFTIIFSVLYKSNDQIRYHFLGFYERVIQISIGLRNNEFDKEYTPQYLKEFVPSMIHG